VLDIYIDGDGCPVKQEVYRVAARYGLSVTIVANSRMQVPRDGSIRLVLVGGQPDAVDDWIVGQVSENDVVVSGDIPLASRCMKQGAKVVDPRGRVFTEDSIAEALATRDLLAHLRVIGTVTGGPAPMRKHDRSRFLQGLDEAIQAVRRAQEPGRPGGRPIHSESSRT
jgi:uncharacterized protein YaiI (UPF0178 family)